MKYLFKRLFDIIFSILLIIILFPIFILISIIIKIDSKGPVFFLQNRLKKNGKVFKIIKFRTMVLNAEKLGTGLFNYKDDPRVTKFGKFLRMTSIDELPQLFNILIGDMSFVGPRPPVSYELGEYKDLSETYKKRFSIKPGVTGLAQISGRNENDWDTKVKMDNLYIERFNKYGIFYDFFILLKTVIKIFTMRDIYEVKDDSLKELSPEQIAEVNNKKILESAKRKEA